MNRLSIFLLMRNNSNECEKTIDIIRNVASNDSLDVIIDVYLLDLLSEKKHVDVIRSITDITYIRFEQDEIQYGKMINQVMQELEIKSDLLIIYGGLLPTETSLLNMIHTSINHSEIGTISPLYNCMEIMRAFELEINGNDRAELLYKHIGRECYDVMITDYGVLYITWDSWNLIGGFADEIANPKMSLIDFQLSVLMSGKRNIFLLNSYFSGTIQNEKVLEKQNVLINDIRIMREKWKVHYLGFRPNINLVSNIPIKKDTSMNILEVGCSCGATLLEIKERIPKSEVYGIELNEHAARIAEVFSNTVVGNIETDGIPFENVKFDVIIFGDVLEHLHDPERTVRMCREYLKEDGYIVASIPNVQHISVLQDLIRGRFVYTDVGLLDRTHIHLFTFREIEIMFQNAGYLMESAVSLLVPLSEEENKSIQKIKKEFPEADEDFMRTFQYLVRAKVVRKN